MELKVPLGHKNQFTIPQQEWEGCDKIQFAQFAGQEVLLITDDAGGFVLKYLGLISVEPYPDMDAGKKAAPGFAKQVLEHLNCLILGE